jgi:hypothetical protein
MTLRLLNPQVEQDVGRNLSTSRTQDRQGGGTIGITSGLVHGQELGFAMRPQGGRGDKNVVSIIYFGGHDTGDDIRPGLQ